MALRTGNGYFLLSSLSLLVIQSATAATPSTSGSSVAEEKNEMVVTATRSETSLWNSPATIQVINSEQLEKSTRSSLADELQDIPGVEVTDNALAGRKQIRIRGEASSRVLILIDGQEVTYQRAGQNFGPGILIDDSSLERIEVVKGPYSVLYGSQAIGGVVNFITRKGGDSPIGGTVKAVYDSATKGWRESANLQGSLGNFDYRVNGSYADHGDRDTPDGRLPDTGFENNSQGVWLGYTLDKHKFGLSLDRYKLSTQTYLDDDSYEEFSVAIPKLEREKVGLFYDFAVDGEYLKSIHLDGYTQKLERDFKNKVKVVTPSGSPMIGNLSVANQTRTEDEQKTYGMTLQSNFSLSENNSLVLGAQFQQDKVTQESVGKTESSSSRGFPAAVNYTKNTQANSKSEQTNWSIFGQDEWKLSDNWTWTLGARQYWLESELKSGNESASHSISGNSFTTLDSRSVSDSAFVTSTSLRYSGFENTELRMAFAQGYVFPTVAQLFMDTSAGGGMTYGNQNLDAEHSNNFEIGARYNGNMWYVDGAVYYSEAKDYIASIACSGQSICKGNSSSARADYYYYDNVDRAKIYGMELSAEYNGWSVAPYASGNILRRQFIGQDMKTWDTGEPSVTGRFGVKYQLPLSALDLTSDLYIRAASKATDNTGTTTQKYPGWATLNLAFNSEFGPENQYQVNLELNNLTDKRYQTAHESIPAAGINAAVGLTWTF
ncbi:TonB-dependent receptor plug domain-containing protein [Limnobaculum xujianqingii]|uniref:TonB-dependent receptor plug domain-containing protein n=1 Tax=Limnobaculum xujianqingii TaxID=2738837 RepID=UPI001127685E|nr:TonB-dependent receptor [Limnobaculum xujianqingii]